MIPVTMQPEPPDFDQKVRQKGQQFLATTTPAKDSDWKNHGYWRAALPELKKGHNNICAYCCLWIPNCPGAPTVDHYLHKSKKENQSLAYEWSNFRLAAGRMNSRKGVFTDVLDPFIVQEGWFIIDFLPTITVKPNPTLPDIEKSKVQASIKRLKLDRDENYLNDMQEWYDSFKSNEITFGHLEKRAPFLAYELRRQGLA